MKEKKYFWGFLLIFIGLFWIMQNLGLITFSLWLPLYKLWPLILVVIGINIIFKNKDFVKWLSWLIFFIILIVYGYLQQNNYYSYETLDNPNVIFDLKPDTVKGNLSIKIGTGTLHIDSTDSELIKGYISNLKLKNKIDYKNNNQAVDIFFEGPNSHMFGINKSDKYSFSLNNDINWNIDTDIGVINGTLDLSSLKVNNLDIDTGVSSIRLILGSNTEYSKVNIDAGISDLELILPKNTGVKINFKGGLKGSNLSNLNWMRNENCYTSPNYNEAENKIDITVNMGIGSLNVVIK